MGEQDGKLDLAKIAGEAKRISEEQAETIRALTDRLGKTERELGEAIKARDEQRGADLAMMEKHVRDFSNRKCFLARLSHILRPAEAPLSVRILSEKDVEWDIAELRMRAGIQFEELAAARSRMMELETDMMTLERDRDGFKIGLQQARERIAGLQSTIYKRAQDIHLKDEIIARDMKIQASDQHLWRELRNGIYFALGLGGTGWDDEHLIAAVKKREEDNRSLSVECGRMERDRDGFSKWLKKSEHAMDGFRTRLAHLLGMMESRDAMVPGVDELLHRVADMVRANHAFAAPAGPDPDKYILPGQIELERVLGLIGSALGMEKRDPAPTSDMILAEIERVRYRIEVMDESRGKWKMLYTNMERERDASDRDRQKWMDQTVRTDRDLYAAHERITVLIEQIADFRRSLTEALAVGAASPLADEAIINIIRDLVQREVERRTAKREEAECEREAKEDAATIKIHKCRSCGTSEEQTREALAVKEANEKDMETLAKKLFDCGCPRCNSIYYAVIGLPEAEDAIEHEPKCLAKPYSRIDGVSWGIALAASTILRELRERLLSSSPACEPPKDGEVKR